MRMLLAIFSIIVLSSANVEKTTDRIGYIKEYSLKEDSHNNYAVLIDMSLPSNEKRWSVVDLKSNTVLYKTYVAHGRGSGEGVQAKLFSDKPGSLCTALGIYKITGSFIGEHGLSYLLEGLESTNKNAMNRGIIIHSAWYATDDFIETNGRCGNSWGCPAISSNALKACEPYLKPGTLVWIFN